MKKINWKKLFIHLAIPFTVGGISALLTQNSMNKYQNLVQPPLTPPSFIFPIVWTILFFLMGLSTYLISQQQSPLEKSAYTIYGIQLFLNFIWPLIFFRTSAYLLAFIWLMLLIVAICRMILVFRRIQPVAGNLQIPYLLWSLFAAYLNFMIYWLN